MLQSYTDDEKALARGLWNEQRGQGEVVIEAAGWVLKNNLGTYGSIQGVMQSMLSKYPGMDPVAALLQSPPEECEYCKEEGLGTFVSNPDTSDYVVCLQRSRHVLNNCGSDTTGGHTHFVNFNRLKTIQHWNIPAEWQVHDFDNYFREFQNAYHALDLPSKRPSFSYAWFGADLFTFNDWNVMTYGQSNEWKKVQSE